ncbi:class I SAM-dependent methyltransferase [Aquidulcibacter sp.]|uniref:class I SAM-dependent methyltransferase n=1 Tax=Aquidulcibacter sp. TaxID=2052990 RepID=UPI0025B9CE71|nr:class I SAM-dependent methyltransferase [Aquidulcibacter sp.]MCA3692588.1 class I SAM-dependent methyltransferase [Aquidulcibacter sp.]
MSGPTTLGVAAAYDLWASDYDGFDNPMVFAAGHALSQASLSLTQKTCLEFGCGTGRNLAALAAGGAAKLIGFDLSGAMLAEARKRDTSWTLFEADMSVAIPLPDQSADFILFSLTLEHVAELEPPLREARRLLRAGGTIKIIEIHPFVSMQGISAHFKAKDGIEVTMPAFAHPFQDWLAAFTEAGLRLDGLKEWRARDLGPDAPPKILRRGLDWPWVVDWTLSPA